MSTKTQKVPVKKWVIRSLFVILLVGAGIYVTPKILYFFSHESTDNAFIEGTIVPVSAEVKGKVAKVFVDNNQNVRAGQALLIIESEDYINFVREKDKALSEAMAEELKIQADMEVKRREQMQARADMAAVEAAEKLSTKEKDRYTALWEEELVSRSQYDHVVSRWMVDKAKTEAAAAAVARVEAEIGSLLVQGKTQLYRVSRTEVARDIARLDLRRTTIKAPITGRIAKKNVDPGKYVQPGQTLLAVVDEKDIWIVANFKETQLKNIKKDQPVDIQVDAYPGVLFKGRVDSFQPGSGAVFSLLPPENATGNFVKVVQRVAVKIVLINAPDPAYPLWPGLSLIPYVNIKP
jgi:membrane fusion protein (multidrug efflux system)